MFPRVNDLWVSKLKKVDVPCGSSWVLNDFIGVVEVIRNFNCLRFEIDKASTLLLQSFDFSTLYTKIDLVDLKACMKVLINKVFNQMLKRHYKFMMVQKTALNFRFLWLKNKVEINLFENLHSFKVAEASNLISWLDFLLDNLFLCFGQGVYRQCIGIPMGTNCEVYLANFYLFIYEFDFIKCLLKSNTCLVVLHSLSLVHKFVDDLFVHDFPDFENFMYFNQDSFRSGIYPKTSCKLICTSKGFSCNSLDLTVSQSPQGLSCDIFDKCSQLEFAGIEMIRMPHVHSNISMTTKLGVINSQFYRFLRLCSCKKFFVFKMVSLIVFLKAKGYPSKVLLKRTNS
jgi:hypothetical protein